MDANFATASPMEAAQVWQRTPLSEISKEISRREAEFEKMRLEFKRLENTAAKVNPVLKLTGGGRRLSDHMEFLAQQKKAQGAEDASRRPEGSWQQDNDDVDFVVKQLGVMAEEKARLKEENARLLREYNSLCDIVTVGLSLDDEENQPEETSHRSY